MVIRCLSTWHRTAIKHIVPTRFGSRAPAKLRRPLSFSLARCGKREPVKVFAEIRHLLRISVYRDTILSHDCLSEYALARMRNNFPRSVRTRTHAYARTPSRTGLQRSPFVTCVTIVNFYDATETRTCFCARTRVLHRRVLLSSNNIQIKHHTHRQTDM